MENGQNVRLPLIFIIFIVAILKVFITDYFPSELKVFLYADKKFEILEEICVQ